MSSLPASDSSAEPLQAPVLVEATLTDSTLALSTHSPSSDSSGDHTPHNQSQLSGIRRGRRSSVDLRLLSYQQCMRHQFPLILTQLNIGLSGCDRLVQFLRKAVILQNEFSSKLIAIASIEESKAEASVGKDGMIKHANVISFIPKLYQSLAERERSFAEQIEKSLISPLVAFISAAELKKTAQLDVHNRKAEQVAQKKTDIDKLRLATLKTWEVVTSLKKTRDKEIAKEGKAKEKTVKSLSKALEHSKKEFSKYEQQSALAAQTIDQFRLDELPNFLQDLEDLEISRMNTIKQIAQSFALLIKQEDSPIANQFNNLIAELIPQTDLNACIDNWLQIHGMPPPSSSVQELPCRSEDLANGQWEISADEFIIPAHAQSVDAPRSSLTASYVSMEEKAKRPASLSRMPSSAKLTGEERAAIPEESPAGSGTQTPELSQRAVTSSLASVNENSSSAAPVSSGPPISLGALSAIDDDAEDPDDDDDDEDKDEQDTIASIKSDRKIKEEWVIACQDYPSKDQVDQAGLLHFLTDDIIKILRKDVDGDSSWWFGELVGTKLPPGKFPNSCIRMIDDKPLIVDEKEENNEKTKSLVDMIRGKVSKKKRRWVGTVNGQFFDLDLTYITPKIIGKTNSFYFLSFSINCFLTVAFVLFVLV
jgi:hypothetical protein